MSVGVCGNVRFVLYRGLVRSCELETKNGVPTRLLQMDASVYDGGVHTVYSSIAPGMQRQETHYNRSRSDSSVQTWQAQLMPIILFE